MLPSILRTGPDARASELRNWRLLNSALLLIVAGLLAGVPGLIGATLLAFVVLLRPEFFKGKHAAQRRGK